MEKLMKKLVGLRNNVKGLVRDESGQTVMEYALMLVLVALAVSAAFPAVVTAVNTVFSDVATALG